MTNGGTRMARGWIGALIATTLAAASHILAGGHAPALPTLLISLALSGLVCSVLAGRLLSMWRLLVGVNFSQALFHGLFILNEPAGVAQPMTGHAGHSTQQMAATLRSVESTIPEMDHSSPVMWLSHIVAAVFTVAILRHGESVAVVLMDTLRLRVMPLLVLVHVLASEADPAPVPGSWPVRVLPSLGIPCNVMRYRGPPPLPALY